MNSDDIDALQDRINRIPLSQAGPEIIIAPKPSLRLHQYMSSFQAELCILRMAYNDLAGRVISVPMADRDGQIHMVPNILEMEHIVAATANSNQEATILANQAIPDVDPSMMARIHALNDLILQGQDILIEGRPSITVHEYIIENIPSATISVLLIRPIYESLKSEINLSGKILSVHAIVGGIQKAFERVPEDEVYNVVDRLEHDGSPLHMSRARFNDAKSWYLSHILEGRYMGNISFYQESLQGLIALRDTNLEHIDIVTYPPSVEMERIVLRSTRVLDMIDMIDDARTSANIPMVMIKQSPDKIIKIFDTLATMRNIRLEWFGESVLKKDNRMNVIVRIRPEKYHIVHYSANKNYFVINIDRRLSMRNIIHTLCSGLNMSTITLPRTLNTTYSFITNYIDLNHHVLAWLITNMPPEYRAINLDKYVFVNENVKPNSFRNHISIHMRLGPEKVYLTISKGETTSGTIVNDDTGNLIGFDSRQRYLMIRVNKAPNIHYARISVEIYRHLVAMYITHFRTVVDTIINETGINPRADEPILQPLYSRIPSLTEIFAYQDPILYRYTSSIEQSILPVPIKREEVQLWRSKGHTIMRLPTTVVNDPMIHISSSGEIWLRTPERGRFTLLRKSSSNIEEDSIEYIPVQIRLDKANTTAITVNDDMTISWFPPDQAAAYILKEDNPLLNKPGRDGHVYNSVDIFMKPVVGIASLRRKGISTNILHRLNNIFGTNVQHKDLVPYAHLCLGECWEQSVGEIAEDLSIGNIEPMKHFRSLEKVFSINIYFLMGDSVEPYLRKPPHALFYLHRPYNPSWKCLIFHSLPSYPTIYSILVKHISGKTVEYLFDDKNGYLDRQMSRNNVIRMVNPVTGKSIIQQTSQGPIHNIGGWIATEQVVDEYGKCRGITYRKQDMEVTLSIGFAPVQDLPTGTPKKPTSQDGIPSILLEPTLQEARSDIEALIMYPSPESSMTLWRQKEKEARILRIVSHLLWSLESSKDLHEWVEDTISVDENVTYDLQHLRHRLSNISGSKEMAWEYLSDLVPGMVDMDLGSIIVPDQSTKDALRLHLLAMPKIRWPTSFPQLVQYPWDLKTRKNEKVFLQETDLIQYMIYFLMPLESTTITTSPASYILKRGGKRYLVQMSKNMQQASSIATLWKDSHFNPGLSAPYDPDSQPISLKRVIPDFQEELKEISYTIHPVGNEEAIFLIIPL